jgi:protease-4
MSNRWLIILLIAVVVLGAAFVLGMFSFILSSSEEGSLGLFGGDKVGVVKVEGTIVSSDDVVEDIEKVRKDSSVASVIVRIDSPGGSVGASQEILEAIKILAKDKPVVASMGTVAASGGYYVALGAKRILANPGTITGSIGVRMEHINVGRLLDWARIGHETLKSGKYKDIGAIDRPLTPEERKILEGVLKGLHEQFKLAVAESRNLDMKDVERIADGRVFTGQEAIELGLIDTIGGFAKAIELAAELGGIEGEPELTYPGKHRRWFMRLVEEARMAVETLAQGAGGHWRPVMSLSK